MAGWLGEYVLGRLVGAGTAATIEGMRRFAITVPLRKAPQTPLAPGCPSGNLAVFCEMDYDRFSKEQHEGADVGSFAPVLVEEGRWELAGAGLDCCC